VLSHDTRLLWSSEESAVEKITAVASGQAALLSAALRKHAKTFSTEMFEERFRKIVETAQVS
jgi:hypothetical protein